MTGTYRWQRCTYRRPYQPPDGTKNVPRRPRQMSRWVPLVTNRLQSLGRCYPKTSKRPVCTDRGHYRIVLLPRRPPELGTGPGTLRTVTGFRVLEGLTQKEFSTVGVCDPGRWEPTRRPDRRQVHRGTRPTVPFRYDSWGPVDLCESQTEFGGRK